MVVFDPWFKPEIRGVQGYGREDEKDSVARAGWTFEDTKAGAARRARCAEAFWPALHIDLRMVDTSDFVIAHCPTNVYSVGTPHEIILARQQRKPVLFVSPPVLFPAVDELRRHLELQGDTVGASLLTQIEQQVPIKSNADGSPSQWYMPLVGGEHFFDGFGFYLYQEKFGWPVTPLDRAERARGPQETAPSIPRQAQRRAPEEVGPPQERLRARTTTGCCGTCRNSTAALPSPTCTERPPRIEVGSNLRTAPLVTSLTTWLCHLPGYDIIFLPGALFAHSVGSRSRLCQWRGSMGVAGEDGLGDLERYRSYLRLLAGADVDAPLQGKLDLSGVVQQTLWEAHQDRGRFSGNGTGPAWTRRLRSPGCGASSAQNLSMNSAGLAARTPTSRRRRWLEESSARLAAELEASDTSPSTTRPATSGHTASPRHSEQLPADQRVAVVRHHLNGVTLAEVAGELAAEQRSGGGSASPGFVYDCVNYSGTMRLTEE